MNWDFSAGNLLIVGGALVIGGVIVKFRQPIWKFCSRPRWASIRYAVRELRDRLSFNLGFDDWNAEDLKHPIYEIPMDDPEPVTIVPSNISGPRDETVVIPAPSQAEVEAASARLQAKYDSLADLESDLEVLSPVQSVMLKSAPDMLKARPLSEYMDIEDYILDMQWRAEEWMRQHGIQPLRAIESGTVSASSS